jgi:ketosteroid isomerase-like protein
MEMTPQSPEIALAIRALDQDFVHNFNASNANRLVIAFYAENAQLLLPDRPAISGRANIRDAWQASLDTGLCDLRLETLQVGISADLAYAIGTYRWAVVSAAGERVEDGGKYLAVYRRQADGLWRAVANVFSRAQPTQQPADGSESAFPHEHSAESGWMTGAIGVNREQSSSPASPASPADEGR